MMQWVYKSNNNQVQSYGSNFGFSDLYDDYCIIGAPEFDNLQTTFTMYLLHFQVTLGIVLDTD